MLKKSPIARIVTLLILSQIIAGLILIPFFSLNIIKPDNYNIETIGIELMTLILMLQAAANILLIYQLQTNYDGRPFHQLGFSREMLLKKLGLGSIIGIISILVIYLTLFFSNYIETSVNTLNLYSFTLYFGFFSIVAINEELLVRGYILNNLLKSQQKYVSIIISALIFMLLHSGNNDVSLLSFVNLLLVGIFLGLYYAQYKDLWFPIGFHLTWNFMQGPVLGFPVSGLPIEGMLTQKLAGSSTLTGGSFGLEGSYLVMTLLILLCAILWSKGHKKNKKPQKHHRKILNKQLIKR
ncbi:CPBP family intramembrane glutamic endopeptidase [Thalassotalea sp. 1_MG-2023]|uniref:CPBP family intramembrane glutamic endopeptidase n=1 Tax=Thalassotalea sp. 1_MG-2023 TaxID=3062680 RepID=UPI0026E381F4|nr:type II CAAX endopeptidase family protein [Thalassotalea sp. 1_MG-2023]